MYVFIINAKAGGGRAAKVRPIIERFMADARATYRVCETSASGDAVDLSREASRAGETVVAVGGDGSIHHVASGLIEAFEATGTPPTLGILPLGTGNDLARMLGMSRKIEESLEVLLRGHVRHVDYGLVDWEGMETSGRRPFINCAGMGLDAQSALLAVKLKPYIGNLCYTLSPALSVWTWKQPNAVIEAVDGTGDAYRWNGKFLLASVANGKWVGGGITISPDARIDDRLLDLCLVEGVRPMRALRILPRAVKGDHIDFPEVTAKQFQTLDVTISHPAPIHLDGEPCTRDATRARFAVSAGQLRVIAPPQG